MMENVVVGRAYSVEHMANGKCVMILAYKNYHCIHAAITIHLTLVYFPLRKLPHTRIIHVKTAKRKSKVVESET